MAAGAPFYTAIPIKEFVRLMEEMRAVSGEVPNVAEDDNAMAELPRVEPNCIIDVSDLVALKERAMLAHRTQISDMDPFMKLARSQPPPLLRSRVLLPGAPQLPADAMLDDMFA